MSHKDGGAWVLHVNPIPWSDDDSERDAALLLRHDLLTIAAPEPIAPEELLIPTAQEDPSVLPSNLLIESRQSDSETPYARVSDVGLPLLSDVIALTISSGTAVGAYQLLRAWIDAKNGRKLKIKVGDIEVEATQMAEKDVLRIFELLQEKADTAKIRDLLLEANKRARPENH
jgi:hypothetical protein